MRVREWKRRSGDGAKGRNRRMRRDGEGGGRGMRRGMAQSGGGVTCVFLTHGN